MAYIFFPAWGIYNYAYYKGAYMAVACEVSVKWLTIGASKYKQAFKTRSPFSKQVFSATQYTFAKVPT